MRTKTLVKNETNVVHWTPYNKLTPKDAVVFNAVMKGFIGIKSTPTFVSKQFGTITKYRFKFSVLMLSSKANRAAIIEVFKNLDGKLRLTRILGV